MRSHRNSGTDDFRTNIKQAWWLTFSHVYLKLPRRVSLFFPVNHILHTMHAIITCIAPKFADAGRQPLIAIHNLADDYSKAIQITVTDDVAGCLCVQVINPAEDSPVITSPVPVPNLKRVRTINKLEGLAMLERRNAHLAQEESRPMTGLTPASSLKRVRTVNKLEGLAMLERRKALLAEQESSSGDVPAQASSLKRVRTINRLDGLAKLVRRKAHIAGKDFYYSIFSDWRCSLFDP